VSDEYKNDREIGYTTRSCITNLLSEYHDYDFI